MCDQVVESCDCVDEETECSDAHIQGEVLSVGGNDWVFVMYSVYTQLLWTTW